jgi:serine/threonine protein kinase
MASLHSHSVFHRDFKPANFLVDQAIVSRICDFGLSEICGFDSTQTVDRSMSFDMDPEIHTETRYGSPVDVFEFTCTVCELITGKGVLEGSGTC